MSVEDRLLARVIVNPVTKCWEWQGARQAKGYGRIRVGSKADGTGRIALTSRISHELFIGPIPDGQDVCHRCDNPCCISPFHIFAGTRKINVQDCIAKGRFKLKPPPPGEDHPQARLTTEAVLEIRSTVGKTKALAEKYGIVPRYVRMLRAGKFGWTHLPA